MRFDSSNEFQRGVVRNFIYNGNHITNIEREAEVIKSVMHDLLTSLAIQARDLGHAPSAAKFLELREELSKIYPKGSRQ